MPTKAIGADATTILSLWNTCQENLATVKKEEAELRKLVIEHWSDTNNTKTGVDTHHLNNGWKLKLTTPVYTKITNAKVAEARAQLPADIAYTVFYDVAKLDKRAYNDLTPDQKEIADTALVTTLGATKVALVAPKD